MRHARTALTLAAVLALAACSGDDAVPAAADAADPTDGAATVAPPTDPAATAEPAVASRDTDLGTILTDADGLTLYGFTNDTDARSACYGTCAEAWPPVLVDVDFTAAPGVDTGILATTVREDGTLQLVAGRWPLYRFAGDAAPGDLEGQGSGGVWFAVTEAGALLSDEAGAPPDAGDDAAATQAARPVATAETSLGEVLVDADGLTLYGFVPDREAGGPTCEGDCADAWPPLLHDGAAPSGDDPVALAVQERGDGDGQLVAGGWPLYRFAGDAAPGDVNGQGSGDVWFAVAPDGALVGADAATTPGDGY